MLNSELVQQFAYDVTGSTITNFAGDLDIAVLLHTA